VKLARDRPAPGPGTTSLKQRAFTGAIWMSIEMAGVQAASFIVFAVMAHFVAPRDFGLISISFLAVQSLQMLVLYNVSTVAVRKRDLMDLDFTTAFWITAGFGLLAFLLLFAISGWAEQLFRAPGLKPVLRAMAVVLLFMGLSRTHETWLMRQFQLKALAIRGIAGAALGGITGVILAVKGFGVTALVGQQIVISVVTTVLLWAVCPWRPKLKFSRTAAAEIFTFMRHIAPNNIVFVINQNCDTFLVALAFGPVSAGFYNMGKRIRLALQLVTGEPIKNIMLPTLAEMQDDPQRLQRGVLNGLSLVCAVCAPAFLGISALSHDLIIAVFGLEWQHAIPILRLLSFSGLAIVLLGYNDNIFILTRRPLWCLYVSLSYTVLAAIAIWVGFELKISAIALPFVVPYAVVLPLSAVLIANRTQLTLAQVAGAILPGIGAATGMFVALQLLTPHLQTFNIFLRLLILIPTGGAAYLALLGLVWPRRARDMAARIMLKRSARKNFFL
jgi:O-antigen/teichoic acid export membrane protein